MERLLVREVSIEHFEKAGDAARIHRLENEQAASNEHAMRLGQERLQNGRRKVFGDLRGEDAARRPWRGILEERDQVATRDVETRGLTRGHGRRIAFDAATVQARVRERLQELAPTAAEIEDRRALRTRGEFRGVFREARREPVVALPETILERDVGTAFGGVQSLSRACRRRRLCRESFPNGARLGAERLDTIHQTAKTVDPAVKRFEPPVERFENEFGT